MATDPTYVACLTAPGTSALATVGVIGPKAWAMVQPSFQPRSQRSPRLGQEQEHWLGRFTAEGLGDEVVLTLSGTPACQQVEMHCHGGRTVLRWILDRLVAAGAVEISWADWLHCMAVSHTHGVIIHALTQATTLRTAEILLAQQSGVLESKLEVIYRADPEEALRHVEELLAWADFGVHLTQPWRVVVAGAPNAGKSSLINALLGYQRAITADLPGTTRDLLTARTAFDGWPVELMDTAGLRDPGDELEALGITRTTAALPAADLVLWLADLTDPVLPLTNLAARRLLVVGNKADQVDSAPSWAVCVVSALTGAGLTDLVRLLVETLIPQRPTLETAIPVSAAMVDSLHTIRAALQHGDVGSAHRDLANWRNPRPLVVQAPGDTTT